MKIAIVDDEQDMRQSISQWPALSGFETETYASAEGGAEGPIFFFFPRGADWPGVVGHGCEDRRAWTAWPFSSG